jgi:DNA mismatch repair protein MutL
MLNIIQLLPDSIANQIAAGEVVQRPASVVKELLENSVDAKAKSIQAVIRDAGRTLIQIIDDGTGMSETDARMSFERHATSKIRTSDDLFKIRTMGFRGEALASIAAVAQVEMRTRRATDELGTLIRIEGSDIKAQESVSCLPGTNFLIKNLFFNVPARRNFLKSNSVEMRHILDEFQRVALAHPEVAFSLFHDDREVYHLPAGKLSRRIVDLFGKNYREQLAACEEETPYVSVHGYIGKPEAARKTRNEQFFFVNNRFVKHNYLHHAVVGAYEGTLPDAHHPFYVLFIEIDPSHIDINIHPTKTEIKFDDERAVYGIMMAAVRKAMGVYNTGPSIDFEGNANFLDLTRPARPKTDADSQSDSTSFANPKPITPSWSQGAGSAASSSAGSATRFEKKDDGFANAPIPQKPSPQNWQALFAGFDKLKPPGSTDAPVDWLAPTDAPIPPERATMTSRANDIVPTATAFDVSELAGAESMQVQDKYLVVAVKTGVLLIDQRRAHERILYDQFKAALTNRTGTSQQLLFPKTVQLTTVDYQLALELRDDLASVGFQFDELGPNTFVIRGIPALTPGENEEQLFANLLAQLREDTGSRLKLDRLEALARSLARRSVQRKQLTLGLAERQAVIDQLFASANPGYTPAGEPITAMLTMDKIAGLFRG